MLLHMPCCGSNTLLANPVHGSRPRNSVTISSVGLETSLAKQVYTLLYMAIASSGQLSEYIVMETTRSANCV
jgi:hypothetical protein